MVASLEEAFSTNLQPIRVKSKKNKKRHDSTRTFKEC